MQHNQNSQLSLFTWNKAPRRTSTATALLSWVPTGLASVDDALGGGMLQGSVTLLAARPGTGGTAFLLGSALAAAQGAHDVGFASERLSQAVLRERLVTLAARINYFRRTAGMLSAEEEAQLQDVRTTLPWRRLHLCYGPALRLNAVEELLAAYRPRLCVCDIRPRSSAPATLAWRERFAGVLADLQALARRYHVALVLRYRLPQSAQPPTLNDVPGLDAATAVLLMERPAEEPDAPRHLNSRVAQVTVLRCGGRTAVAPASAVGLQLLYDQRYFGFSVLPACTTQPVRALC